MRDKAGRVRSTCTVTPFSHCGLWIAHTITHDNSAFLFSTAHPLYAYVGGWEGGRGVLCSCKVKTTGLPTAQQCRQWWSYLGSAG